MSNPTSESQLVVRLENDKLVINYTPETNKAIYDICGFEGKILITGKILDAPELVVDLEGYPSGHYNLFVLDGSEVYKEVFLLESQLAPQKMA